MVVRIGALAYGVVCYILFFGTFLYLIGFVGNLVVPKSINTGSESPMAWALLINTGLLALFALQHSIMARQWFKKGWTKIVPKPIERSTFVLLTCVALGLIFWQWRPMTNVVWEVTNPIGSILLNILFWLGIGVVLLATFIIDHFDLFGLRQVYLYAIGKPYTLSKFKVTLFYRYVRHPLLLGFIISFWASPHMTLGHLSFAVITTFYMLLAIHLEERDLVEAHGEDYVQYRSRVSMLIPFLRPSHEKVLGKGTSQPTSQTG